MHHPPSVRSSALVAVHEDLQVHHAAEPLVVEDEDALDHDDLARLHERGLGTASVRGEVVLRNLHVLPVPQLAYGFAALVEGDAIRRVEVVPGGSVRGERANFTRLVLGCIEAKFCKKILVGKLSPRSTQCTPLHRSLISIFSLKHC